MSESICPDKHIDEANVNIFSFEDPVKYVLFEFDKKRKKNPRFSIRAWSKQLGYNNPSLLACVMRGQRRLKMDLAHKISLNLKMNSEEQRYFEMIVLLHNNSEGPSERDICLQFLRTLRPTQGGASYSAKIDIFSFLSSWSNVAIFEMLNLKNFTPDPLRISERLGHGATPVEVEKSIELLQRLNLIAKTESGGLLRTDDSSLLLENEVPSSAIQLHHLSMMELAKQALSRQLLDERNFRSSTIPLKISNFKAAEEIIRSAHAQIVALSAKGDGDEVYQLNTQFFRLNEVQGDKGGI